MSLALDKSAWKRVKLGDVARHVTDRVDAETSGLKYFLAGEHIPSARLAITERGVIGRDPVGPMFYKRFQPGHVLYVSRRTYLRKVAVPEFEGITGEKTFVLESLDEGVLLQRYLPFVLSAERFHDYAILNSRGSVNPYLNWGELADYEFELPPLGEQQRITDLLWSIELHERSLSQRSASASRVTDSIRRTSFDALASPREPLTAVCAIASGTGFPHRFQGREGGTVPVLKVSDLGEADEVSTAANRVSDADILDMKAKVWPPGTTIFPKVGAALLSERRRILGAHAAFDNNIMGLVPGERLRPRFLLDFMKTVQLSRVAQTGVIPSVNNKHIGKITIPVPELLVQDDLLSKMDSARHALDACNTEIDRLRTLRAALFTDIFGGY